MFTIDPKINEKILKGKNIFKVLVSMNNHQVATPETSLEEARSYVFFFREGRNRFSAYIGLHLLLTDRKLIYAHSENPFSEDKMPEIEDEARDFAEYLGAMMDEVPLAAMSDLEQDKWIENQGIFSTKTQPETATVEKPPLQEVAATVTAPAVAPAPAPKPPATPEQPAPVSEAISAPEPAATPVQSEPKAHPEKAKEQPREAPVTETVRQDVQSEDLPPAAAKRSRETAKKETTASIETPPKQSVKKISYSATSVVSRDREALARLLSSF